MLLMRELIRDNLRSVNSYWNKELQVNTWGNSGMIHTTKCLHICVLLIEFKLIVNYQQIKAKLYRRLIQYFVSKYIRYFPINSFFNFNVSQFH